MDIDKNELISEIQPFKDVMIEIQKNLKSDPIYSIFKHFTNLNLKVAYPNIDVLFRLFFYFTANINIM